MEVEVVRDHEIFRIGLERRSVRLQDVASHLPHVEAAGEEIVLVLAAPGGGLQAFQAAGGGGSEVAQHRHHVPRPRVAGGINHVPVLAIDSAVHGVQQAVAVASARMH